MNLSHKKIGLATMALAAGLLGSVTLADTMGPMHRPGMMGGPAGRMGLMPALDFAAADANKDGKVTPEEFAAYRAAEVGSIDTDKDGKISADELAAMHLKAMEAAAKAMADRMVKALDTDGDGKLSAAELLAAPVPPDAFAKADANHDGVIDPAEAEAMTQPGPRGWGDHHGKPHGKRPMMAPDQQGPDQDQPADTGDSN